MSRVSKSRLDIRGYLSRLGLPEDPAGLGLADDRADSAVAALFALHRAHAERVPYENLEIQLGAATTLDPFESAERIVRRRRGGYCYHLNGAFATLLSALGYRVRWHVGGAQTHRDDPPRVDGGHLALTVHGLVTPACPDGVWLVDVGLGDALYEPLPLRPGTFRQEPFIFTLDRSTVVPFGWRFHHDPVGSFVRMDFAPAAAGPADFRAKHAEQSTSPDSPFVRRVVVQRRDLTGVDNLRGRILSRIEGAARTAAVFREEELTSAAGWYEALADVFGLTLDDIAPQQRQALWQRVCRAHEAWLRARPGAWQTGAAAAV